MTTYITEYDYLASLLRALMNDSTLSEKVDSFVISYPMQNIKNLLSSNSTIVGVSYAHIYTKGRFGSAIHHIQENSAIIQIDIVTRNGSNLAYAHEISSRIKDILYLWTEVTIGSTKYNIYNDHIDTDIAEYDQDLGAWRIVLSNYVDFFRSAPTS